MQVSSWKSASCGGSALEMFERELGQVFSFPTTLSSELGQRGSTPGTRWSGMMWICHQETLQVLLMAGPDYQQARYPTCILCHKQQSSHTPRNRSAPGGWHHQCPCHGGSHSPYMGTLPAHPRFSPSLPRPCTAAPADTFSSPVQFSKEKYILDSSPEKLHKELEEELKLSSTDLRSHAWYHGRIPREVRRGRWVALGTLFLGCSGRAPKATQNHQPVLGSLWARASLAPSCLVLSQKTPCCSSEPRARETRQCCR